MNLSWKVSPQWARHETLQAHLMVLLSVESFVVPSPTVQNQLLEVMGCHTRSSRSRFRGGSKRC